MDAINSFVSIDFETANASRVSACSLGFAKVINGEIVDHCTFLIKPVGGFSPINMMINGITPNKVTDAPTFDALLPTLREKSCGLPLLCFTRFDVSVLEELSAYYCINYSPDLKIYDVCEFARSCLPGLPNYRLDTLAETLHLPAFTHHDAEADAIQCANIYLSLSQGDRIAIEDTPTESWESMFIRAANGFIADRMVTLEEAYELQQLLGEIADKSRLMRSIFDMVHVVLEDGRVSKAESKLICAMLEYAIQSLRPQQPEPERPAQNPFGYDTSLRLKPDGLEIPDGYAPIMKPVPDKYKERWPYVKEHPFATLASSQVAITGTGTQIDRITAEEMVVALGATLKNSIPTRTTDFCVVLGSDPESTDTGKCCRARELIAQGSPIRIIGEDEFIDLLRASIAESSLI